MNVYVSYCVIANRWVPLISMVLFTLNDTKYQRKNCQWKRTLWTGLLWSSNWHTRCLCVKTLGNLCTRGMVLAQQGYSWSHLIWWLNYQLINHYLKTDSKEWLHLHLWFFTLMFSVGDRFWFIPKTTIYSYLWQWNKSWTLLTPIIKFQQLNSELSYMKHFQEVSKSDFHCF